MSGYRFNIRRGSNVKHRILVIDDDRDLAEMLRMQLELRSHKVVVALNGPEGLRKAYKTRPDLIILDVMMPGMSGWEVCVRLRELSSVPIIMLTACVRESDVVKGLQIGVDDYVKKPFSARELEARIQAVLRRCKADKTKASRTPFYSNGHLSVDFDRRLVKIQGRDVDLSPTEFKLLCCLVRNEGRVLPHRYLLTEVWGPEYVDEVDYVKLYIRYLRRKIEKDPSAPEHILTEWGVGYRFN
jgi:two-component system KDP operon response regulator KdpE